jgi:hypothetical protein
MLKYIEAKMARAWDGQLKISRIAHGSLSTNDQHQRVAEFDIGYTKSRTTAAPLHPMV